MFSTNQTEVHSSNFTLSEHELIFGEMFTLLRAKQKSGQLLPYNILRVHKFLARLKNAFRTILNGCGQKSSKENKLFLYLN